MTHPWLSAWTEAGEWLRLLLFGLSCGYWGWVFGDARGYQRGWNRMLAIHEKFAADIKRIDEEFRRSWFGGEKPKKTVLPS